MPRGQSLPPRVECRLYYAPHECREDNPPADAEFNGGVEIGGGSARKTAHRQCGFRNQTDGERHQDGHYKCLYHR